MFQVFTPAENTYSESFEPFLSILHLEAAVYMYPL